MRFKIGEKILLKDGDVGTVIDSRFGKRYIEITKEHYGYCQWVYVYDIKMVLEKILDNGEKICYNKLY